MNLSSGTARCRLASAVALLLVLSRPAGAADPPGEGALRAAIRSEGHACNRVIEVTPGAAASEGPAVWQVTCNSGQFVVTTQADGSYRVTAVQ